MSDDDRSRTDQHLDDTSSADLGEAPSGDYQKRENGEFSQVEHPAEAPHADALLHLPGPHELLSPEIETTLDLLSKTRSEATKRAYRGHWRRFTAWCVERNLKPLPAPPEVVATYIGAFVAAGKSLSYINQALAAISTAHQLKDYESPRQSPLVRETLKGARQELGLTVVQKAPLLTEQLLVIREHLPPPPVGTRDWSLITTGFAGGFRRSPLAALEVRHLNIVDQGLEITVEKDKTDQERRGRLVVIAYGSQAETCPVRALRGWLEVAKITEGPVFRPIDRHGRVLPRALTAAGVSFIVKRCAERAGLDPKVYGGHSLRAGFVTEAKRRGADDRAIMAQTGHRSIQVLHGYHRQLHAWERPASAKLGL